MLIPKPYRVLDQERYSELLKIEKLHNDNAKKSNSSISDIDHKNSSSALDKSGHGALPLSNVLEDKERHTQLTRAPNSIPDKEPPKDPSKRELSNAISHYAHENSDVLQKTQDEVLKNQISPLCKIPHKYKSKATTLLNKLEEFQDSIYNDKGLLVINLDTIPNSDVCDVFENIFNDKLTIKQFYKIPGVSELVDYAKSKDLLDLFPSKIQKFAKRGDPIEKKLDKSISPIQIPKKGNVIPLDYFSVISYT